MLLVLLLARRVASTCLLLAEQIVSVLHRRLLLTRFSFGARAAVASGFRLLVESGQVLLLVLLELASLRTARRGLAGLA